MEGEIRSCLIIINIYITTLSDRVPSHDIQVPFDSKFSSLQLFIKFIKHNGWFSLLSSSPSRKKLTCNHHLIHKGTVSNQKKRLQHHNQSFNPNPTTRTTRSFIPKSSQTPLSDPSFLITFQHKQFPCLESMTRQLQFIHLIIVTSPITLPT